MKGSKLLFIGGRKPRLPVANLLTLRQRLASQAIKQKLGGAYVAFSLGKLVLGHRESLMRRDAQTARRDGNCFWLSGLAVLVEVSRCRS